MDLRSLLTIEKLGSVPDPTRSRSEVLCELNCGLVGGMKVPTNAVSEEQWGILDDMASRRGDSQAVQARIDLKERHSIYQRSPIRYGVFATGRCRVEATRLVVWTCGRRANREDPGRYEVTATEIGYERQGRWKGKGSQWNQEVFADCRC